MFIDFIFVFYRKAFLLLVIFFVVDVYCFAFILNRKLDLYGSFAKGLYPPRFTAYVCELWGSIVTNLGCGRLPDERHLSSGSEIGCLLRKALILMGWLVTIDSNFRDY